MKYNPIECPYCPYWHKIKLFDHIKDKHPDKLENVHFVE